MNVIAPMLRTVLVLFFLAAFTKAQANSCKRAFEILARSPATGDTSPLTDAQADEIFQAAHTAYNSINPGNRRPEGGRSLNVPPEIRDVIAKRLKNKMDSEFAAAPAKGDFIAMGNAGHMKMYHTLIGMDSQPEANRFPNGAIADIFGLSPQDIQAIVTAHDNDKQLPKPGDPLAASALKKLGGPLAAIEYAVGLHGHKSLQRLAQTIRELGTEKGWTEEEQYHYFAAFADQVGGHNFGIDLMDLNPETLRKRYPSLSEAEAKALIGSFYDKLVNQGGQFGPVGINTRMGFSTSDRDGHLRSPLARQLIHLDRGTILDWKKVGGQNLGSMDFNPTTMEITFRATATGALAQVKAMADMRAEDVLPNRGYYVDAAGKPVAKDSPGATFKPYTVADLPSHAFFLSEGERWLKAADKLKVDNGIGFRRDAGLVDSVDAATGKTTYDKAVLYRPLENNGTHKYEYIVRGDYTQVEGKGPKTYQLKTLRRDISANTPGNWVEIEVPKDAKNPMDVLGELMIQHGDLSKPL